jgi:hypothetical protein
MSLADLMKKGSLRQFATVTGATVRPDSRPSVATVATVNVATAHKEAANDPSQVLGLVTASRFHAQVTPQTAVTHDPDRWAWPHSTAMTGREIDTFTARLHHFTRRGLLEPDAETLADKLVTRDRDADERRLCLECANLARNGLCKAVTTGGKPIESISTILQRCDSFAAQL